MNWEQLWWWQWTKTTYECRLQGPENGCTSEQGVVAMVRDATLMAGGTLMDKEVVVMHGSEWQRWSISTNEWQPNLCDLEALNGMKESQN